MKVICNGPSKLTQSGITVINPDYKLQWHVSTTNVHLHANEIRFNALLNLKERRKKSVFLKSNLIAYPFKTPYFYLNTIETRFMASILVLCVLRKKNICIQYFFNIMKCDQTFHRKTRKNENSLFKIQMKGILQCKVFF